MSDDYLERRVADLERRLSDADYAVGYLAAQLERETQGVLPWEYLVDSAHVAARKRHGEETT